MLVSEFTRALERVYCWENETKGVMNMEQSPQVEACIICGEPKPSGIRICSRLICEECEAEIVRTDALDVRYSFFIHRMRRIWYKESS